MSTTSMTGFGRGEAREGGVSVTVELSTVNRKQFDCHVSLPREIAVLEPQVQTLLQKFIRRGDVKGSVTLSLGAASEMTVDLPLAEARLAALRDAAKKLGLRDDLSASTLFQIPDAVRFAPPAIDAQSLWPLVSSALEIAAKSLVAMRRREGRVLAKDLSARLARLGEIRGTIVRRAAVSPAAYRDKLAQRLEKLADGVPADPELLARELVVFADRTDVTEEQTRLGSHLDQAERLMKSREPAGRALDFLCQEMLREINTTGSKACDAEIAAAVVEFKSLLETFREQVQNVE